MHRDKSTGNGIVCIEQRFPLSAATRNLVRFCRHMPHESMDELFACVYAFRAEASRFSIMKSVRTTPGPDECWGHYARDARPLFRKLLGLKLDYEGLKPEQEKHRALYNSMSYYRSHIEEVFFDNGIDPWPPVEGHCLMLFIQPDQLRISYTLTNKSAADVPMRLSWFAEGEPGLSFRAQPGKRGFIYHNTHTVSRLTYQSHARLEADIPGLNFRADQNRLESNTIRAVLKANQQLEFHFLVTFWFNREQPVVPLANWARPARVQQVIRRTEQAYARLPPLRGPFTRFRELTLKAAGTLLSLRYRDYDRQGRRVTTIHAGKAGVVATWFWDTAFTLVGLGIMKEAETARGAAGLLLDGIQADGMPCVMYSSGKYHPGYQIPILAWGIGHYLALNPDLALLKKAYPALKRYALHWWEKYAVPGHDLVIFPPGYTCLDESYRWRTIFPIAYERGADWTQKTYGKSEVSLFECPDINAFVYIEFMSLARMASALGQHAEANQWTGIAKRIAAAINTRLFDPATGTYQDRYLQDGRFTGFVTAYSFIPVYAGIAPRRVARRMCQKYLLNRDCLNTPMPFSDTDRSHPMFRSGGFLYAPPGYPPGTLVPQGYDSGRAWPHISTWLLGALCQAGLTKEADEVALRILSVMDRSEAIYECYDSLTGYGNGHAEFMWSSAAALVIANQYYKRYPVPALGDACYGIPAGTRKTGDL